MTIEIIGITERHELATNSDHHAIAVYNAAEGTLAVDTIHAAYLGDTREGERRFVIPPLTEPADVAALLTDLAAVLEDKDADECALYAAMERYADHPQSVVVDPVEYAGLALILGDAVITGDTTDSEIEALAAQLTAEALEHGDELWDEDALISRITDYRDNLKDEDA